MHYPLDQKKRLKDSVLIDKDGCWIWKLSKTIKKGIPAYGKVTISSGSIETKRYSAAHRYSYQIFIGEIPKGSYVIQKCHQSLCISPQHLCLINKRRKKLARLK